MGVFCARQPPASTDTLTRSASARATSAAFKPRMSTVTKSWVEVFMHRRMEGKRSACEAGGGPAKAKAACRSD
jgi:hypothetical protein